MPKVKSILFWLFVAAAVGGGGYAYFNLKNSKKPKINALSVLPDSCLVYLNTPNFSELNKKLNSQNLLVDRLKLFSGIDGLCRIIQTFDSLIGTNSLLQENLNDNVVHFAMYKNLGWIAAFNIKQLGEQKAVTEALGEILRAAKTEDEVYAFDLNPNNKIYFTLNAGVAIISDKKESIARSLDPALSKLQNNKAFLKYKTTLEETSPLSIYVNHALYANSRAASQLNLSALCHKGYSAGSVDMEPSQITVNGFMEADSSEIISVLHNQEAQETEFMAQMPLSTSSFTAYGFSNFTAMKQKTARLFPEQNTAFWKTASDSALYNLETDFNENATTYLVDFKTGFSAHNFIALKISDTLKAAEHLGFMSDSSFTENGSTIYKLRTGSHNAGPALFTPFAGALTQYAALHQSGILFSHSKNELSGLLANLQNNLLLSGNKSFSAYSSQNFPEAFNYLIYCAPNMSQQDIEPFFNFKTRSEKNPFENFKHLSFCVTNHANDFKFRWHLLNEAETMNKEHNILWGFDLDAESSMQPGSFVNHLTKENELVVQDDNNTLYLLNAKGNMLWKKQLGEKIESQVYTVDGLRNNKYQVLFNTKNYLHLIDRNGNYVKGYPVKLPAEASTALAVFDYDNNKDYRLLIACKNRTIYNYDVSGAMQGGFAPVKTESQVQLPVQYVKVGPSDYLVALDNEGKIYTFSRKGAGRIGLKNKAVENCRAFYIDGTSNINSTNLVYADDKNSLLSKISFTDKKGIIKLNADIANAGVSFALIDENRIMDMIFTKPNAITAYDLNGTLLFEKPFETNLSETGFYSDENRSVLYTYSAEQKELLIIDQLTQRILNYKATAMPLIVNLFNDNKKYLVITNGKRVNCVMLN